MQVFQNHIQTLGKIIIIVKKKEVLLPHTLEYEQEIK